ncbi:MAG: hypothetical protein J6P31_03895 [Oscillospiraceae bacterium]|nr:hypothetical protein [Oscillospiraceae bacterium]
MKRNQKRNPGALLSCSYLRSGDRKGSSYQASVLQRGPADYVLMIRECASSLDPVHVRIYQAEKNCLKQLETIAVRSGMDSWSNLPIDRSLFHVDMPSPRMDLSFEKCFIHISYNSVLSAEGRSALIELYQALLQWATPDRLLEQYDETADM